MHKTIFSFVLVLLASSAGFSQEANNATERLKNQNAQFTEQIVKVAENVYVAVGYNVSNVSMIVGDDGIVIIDTPLTLDDAGRNAAEFRKLSDKPVKAIVFTHSHGDHTGWADASLGNQRPQIWGHALAADDNQWAAQLTDHLLAINVDDKNAKQIKADALTRT